MRGPRLFSPLPPAWQLRLLLVLRRSNTSQAGLSLLECLVAMVIITLTVVAITPPIFLATATRIQAARADRANQIAQGEIDRIRAIVERGGSYTNLLPGSAGNNLANVRAVSAATPSTVTGSLLASPGNCSGTTAYPTSGTQPAWNALIRVDVDGDCKGDYVMQVFRANEARISATDPPTAFTVGVRVYAYFPDVQAVPALATIDASNANQQQGASLVMGTGQKDVTTGGARRPLAVVYSQISRTSSSSTLQYLGQ